MQANLIAPCPPIQQIENDATLSDLIEWSVEVVNQYNECKNKHKALSGAANKNIEVANGIDAK